MPNLKPTISSAELKVLEILWASSPLSANQIIEALEKVEPWQDRTIKTLINRLLKKKVIGYKKDKNRYLYFPLLKKNEYQKTMSRSFIQRIFGGRISPLVAYFASQEKISKDDLKELKKIIQEIESNKNS